MSKYESIDVCVSCYIFLTGINCNGDDFKNESEEKIIDVLLKNIAYKDNYFHFYYKFENEFKYKKRLFQFNKLNLKELYNNGWEFINKKADYSSNILIYRAKNFISFVSISSVFVYLKDNRYILKLYDFDNLDNTRYLNHFVKSKLPSLEPFIFLYAD